jgi:type 1 glutamine amidotransferase
MRILIGLLAFALSSTAAAPRFKMVVLHELGSQSNPDQHKPYVDACRIWLDQLAKDSNFTVAYQETPDNFTDAFLEDVAIVFQMNYPPFGWKASAAAAFQKWIESGKGSLVGVHHASLYGPAITSQTWPWYQKLLGGINYKAYISKFASGDVRVEAPEHPIFAGVPAKFNISTEEWYTWDKSPRPNVKVLANLDEASMKFVDQSQSGTKMGDHPVVWTYEGYKGRNLYIFMGHHPNLFQPQNSAYPILLRNSLMWAANRPVSTAVAPAADRAHPARAAKRLGKSGVTFSAPSVAGEAESGRNAAGRILGQ